MSQIKNYTATWIETPLSKFGFKCVMSKHDLCVDSLCECLCLMIEFCKDDCDCFKCMKKFRFLTDLELQNLKSVGKKIEKKKPNKTGLDEFFWS